MVRLAAVNIRGQQPTQTFTDEFRRMMRGANLTGAYFFWEALQQIVTPDSETSLYAEGVLRVLAESVYAECGGEALSPQLAEIFRRYGLVPSKEYESC
jgi:hypothetical protein